MNVALGFLSICLASRHIFIHANGVFYEEMLGPNGVATFEDSSRGSSFIHETFHLCSMTETCNFVIKNIASGMFSQYSSEAEFPQSKTGFRVWKKSIPGVHDCQYAHNTGFKRDGVFTINIPVIGFSKVRCDMTTPPGGWIVFQRRTDGSVDFHRNWADYKEGFGDLNGNFWLGLGKLHQLAAPGKGAKLRVDLKHMDFPGQIKYAEYSLFEISNEADGYKLAISNYSGNAGDSLFVHNGMKFTTKDIDNDLHENNCAAVHTGGWWFVACFHSNLNGLFPSNNSTTNWNFMSWYRLFDTYGGIIFSEMKIRF